MYQATTLDSRTLLIKAEFEGDTKPIQSGILQLVCFRSAGIV